MRNVMLRLCGASLLVGLALLNQACEPGPTTPISLDTDTRCAYGGGTYHRASQAGLTLTRLIVDNHTLISSFKPFATYDGEPAACFDETTNTAALIFEVDGQAYGRIVVGSEVAGTLDMEGADGTLLIDLFGEQDPVVFSRGNFVTGSWLVDQVRPSLQTDVFGDAQLNGRFLTITFAADVKP